MRLRSLRPLLAAGLVLPLTVVLLSCTSSGDGGTGGTGEFLERGLNLESDLHQENEWIQFTKESGDRSSACISVDATRGLGVFSAAFTVAYDASELRYASHDTAGSCLVGTSSLPALVDASTPGEIVVGFSRNAASTTTGVSCGHLLTICFDVIDEGDSRLEFVPNLAWVGPPPTNAALDMEWVGADVKTRL